jgi:hypothetical protein
MKPEGEIENYILKQSEKNNVLCYKFVSPGNKGVPDRILIGNGKTVFVELKAPGEKPRELQKYVIKKMKKAGADVRVADTKRDVDIILKDILSKKNTCKKKDEEK